MCTHFTAWDAAFVGHFPSRILLHTHTHTHESINIVSDELPRIDNVRREQEKTFWSSRIFPDWKTPMRLV